MSSPSSFLFFFFKVYILLWIFYKWSFFQIEYCSDATPYSNNKKLFLNQTKTISGISSGANTETNLNSQANTKNQNVT